MQPLCRELLRILPGHYFALDNRPHGPCKQGVSLIFWSPPEYSRLDSAPAESADHGSRLRFGALTAHDEFIKRSVSASQIGRRGHALQSQKSEVPSISTQPAVDAKVAVCHPFSGKLVHNCALLRGVKISSDDGVAFSRKSSDATRRCICDAPNNSPAEDVDCRLTVTACAGPSPRTEVRLNQAAGVSPKSTATDTLLCRRDSDALARKFVTRSSIKFSGCLLLPLLTPTAPS